MTIRRGMIGSERWALTHGRIEQAELDVPPSARSLLLVGAHRVEPSCRIPCEHETISILRMRPSERAQTLQKEREMRLTAREVTKDDVDWSGRYEMLLALEAKRELRNACLYDEGRRQMVKSEGS